MIDALIKRVSVTYKCYEMYGHRGKIVQIQIQIQYFIKVSPHVIHVIHIHHNIYIV